LAALIVIDSGQPERLVRVPYFPLYSHVRYFIVGVAGVSRLTLSALLQSIHEQMGTPRNPVDWSNPDEWIAERLTGDEATLAQAIWDTSAHHLNPRHLRGCHYFCQTYKLLTVGQNGEVVLTERGERFMKGDVDTLLELDRLEGLIELLNVLSTKGQVQRSDVLPEWSDFLGRYSGFGTESTRRDTLYRRMNNLIERQFVSRDGNKYAITQSGVQYVSGRIGDAADPKRAVIASAQQFNEAQRQLARQKLAKIHPYQFERLIGQLLEQMGYEDVEVTKQSGDWGVDVTATVQFGITTVREFVQVKRTPKNIQRPTLDQLRGALPYYHALRGTLITLGDFSKGCAEAALFPGAAPLTLINGDKLLDLMIQHEVGFASHIVRLMEFDELSLPPVEGERVTDADTLP
jgi:restriction system protein